MLNSSKVLFWEVGVCATPEEPQIWSPGRLLNLVQIIVSQTTSYTVSFNFLCLAVKKFHCGRGNWGAGVCPPPRRNPKFGPSNKNI